MCSFVPTFFDHFSPPFQLPFLLNTIHSPPVPFSPPQIWPIPANPPPAQLTHRVKNTLFLLFKVKLQFVSKPVGKWKYILLILKSCTLVPTDIYHINVLFWGKGVKSMSYVSRPPGWLIKSTKDWAWRYTVQAESKGKNVVVRVSLCPHNIGCGMEKREKIKLKHRDRKVKSLKREGFFMPSSTVIFSFCCCQLPSRRPKRHTFFCNLW